MKTRCSPSASKPGAFFSAPLLEGRFLRPEGKGSPCQDHPAPRRPRQEAPCTKRAIAEVRRTPEGPRWKNLAPSPNSANTRRMRFEKATCPSGFSETDHSVLQNERTMMDIIDSAMDTLKSGVSAARGAVSGVAVEQLAFVRGFCPVCATTAGSRAGTSAMAATLPTA